MPTMRRRSQRRQYELGGAGDQPERQHLRNNDGGLRGQRQTVWTVEP